MIQTKRSGRRALVIANLAMCVGMFAACLWPFQFFPKNNVQWLGDRKGLSLGGRGILFSSGFFNVDNRNSSTPGDDSVSLEIWAEAQSESGDVAHILSLYGREADEKFFIGQWNSLLLLQARTGAGASVQLRKLGVEGGLPINQARVLTITSSRAGTAVYLDGRLANSSTNQFLNSYSLSGRLVLGDSNNGKNGWKGNFYGLAVYDRELNPQEVSNHYRYWLARSSALAREEGIRVLYRFDDGSGDRLRDSLGGPMDLVIPPYFRALNKSILVPPWKEYFPNWPDIAANIAGFVPLGLLLCAWFKNSKTYSFRGCVIRTVLIGGLISLTIELLQVYLPDRSSSLTDLVTNMFGAAVGASVCGLFYKPLNGTSVLAGAL